MAAVVAFGQYTPRVLYGDYQFVIAQGATKDTIFVYPSRGGIVLDTTFFEDGTKQWTTAVGNFVKLTGDTMAGTYLLNTGSLNMGSGVDLNMSGGTNEINFSNTTTYSTKGVKINDEELIMRSLWGFDGALGITVKPDTIMIACGYNGWDVDTITSSSMMANSYTFDIPTVEFTGDVTVDGNFMTVGIVSVEKSLQVGNDATAASAANVGAIRYRSDVNNSYCEMVMQTGTSTYAWVVIKQNTW